MLTSQKSTPRHNTIRAPTEVSPWNDTIHPTFYLSIILSFCAACERYSQTCRNDRSPEIGVVTASYPIQFCYSYSLLVHSTAKLLTFFKTVEHPRGKTKKSGFQTGPTQTGLYKQRRWLETGNFGLRNYRNCTIRVAKTKARISFAVTAKLICDFVFAYADCWFS